MGIDSVETQIFMIGRGGQGVLLLARALSEIAFKRGLRLISSETHGMAMRGGTVTASLKIGPFESPLIPAGCADILIGLDKTEAGSHMYMLKGSGISIVNAEDKGPFHYVIDATSLALHLSAPGSINMIMLGHVLDIVGHDLIEARSIARAISPKRSVQKNIQGIEAGFNYLRCKP